MGTKNLPGAYDCYAKAEPDEPMFILLGRDSNAPAIVEQWALDRERLINRGIKPESDRAMVAEARTCAQAMRGYRIERKQTVLPLKLSRYDVEVIDRQITRLLDMDEGWYEEAAQASVEGDEMADRSFCRIGKVFRQAANALIAIKREATAAWIDGLMLTYSKSDELFFDNWKRCPAANVDRIIGWCFKDVAFNQLLSQRQ